MSNQNSSQTVNILSDGEVKRFELSGVGPRPDWWFVRPDEIKAQCEKIKKGVCTVEATTPMGFPVHRVVYNDFETTGNTVNWISAVGCRNPELFSNADIQTVMITGGIHGCEIEGVVLIENLISLLETGVDLRGEKRPELLELVSKYRLVLFPCVNMDGRAISPDHRINAVEDECRQAGGGIWSDGSTIVWPQMKEHFPLPLDKVIYKGGYPNSEGYNIQLDGAPGNVKTAEAEAILKTAAEKKVDMFLNLHSQPGSPLSFITEPSVCSYPYQIEVTNELRVLCSGALTVLGYKNPFGENSKLECSTRIDINTAVQMCCGAAAATFEFAAREPGSFERILETGYVMLETVLKYGLSKPFCDRKNWHTLNKK